MNSFIVYDSLNLGKENALNADVLVSMHGLKSERELRHLVECERAQGALILSGNDGYYRPRTREEMIECKARYISMARGIIAIVNLIDNNLKPFEGQISLFDVDGEREVNEWMMQEGLLV